MLKSGLLKNSGVGRKVEIEYEYFRKILSRSCDCAGTQEAVDEVKKEVLKDMGCNCAVKDVRLMVDTREYGTLDMFSDIFWDKVVEVFFCIWKNEEGMERIRRILKMENCRSCIYFIQHYMSVHNGYEEINAGHCTYESGLETKYRKPEDQNCQYFERKSSLNEKIFN